MRRSKGYYLLVTTLVVSLGACTVIEKPAEQTAIGISDAPGSTEVAEADSYLGWYYPARDDLPFAPYTYTISHFTAEDYSADEDASKTRWVEIQGFLAECMHERGFTYYPVPWTTLEASSGFFSDGAQLILPRLPDSRAEAARIGYGVMPPQQLELWDSFEQEQNSSYRDSLSPQARDQYDFALHRDPVSTAGTQSEPACGQLAVERYPSVTREPSAKEQFVRTFIDLYQAMNTLDYQDIYSNPRLRTLNAEWAGCMNKRGYDFTSGFSMTSIM